MLFSLYAEIYDNTTIKNQEVISFDITSWFSVTTLTAC